MPTDTNTCKYYGTFDETGHIRCATCPYIVDRYLCSCSLIQSNVKDHKHDGIRTSQRI